MNELPPIGQIILLLEMELLTKEKVLMDIIRMPVSKHGLPTWELLLLPKKKVDNHCLPKISDEICIPAKNLIVPMILSKQSKNLDHFL